MRKHTSQNEIQDGVRTPEETQDKHTIANAAIDSYKGDTRNYVTNATKKGPQDTYTALFAKYLKTIQKKHARENQ